MRIGIDVRYLSHGLLGGVHHYVSQLSRRSFDTPRGTRLCCTLTGGGRLS
jgi:hypothetical protein